MTGPGQRQRCALDHHSLDDEFWARLAEHYDQCEIVERTMSIGAWIVSGRLDHVLGLDTAAVLLTAVLGGRTDRD